MSATHNDRISSVIVLGPAQFSERGFGTVLILADEAEGTTLDGDRVRTYESYQAAQADSANLGDDVLEALRVAFSQPRPPAQIKVGRVDTAGSETWLQGYQACLEADGDFYGVVALDTSATNQVALSAQIEAERRIFVAQSGLADWLTSGGPSAISAIKENERTAFVYHDEADEYAAVALAVNRLSFNPDNVSAPWSCRLAAVAPYTTGLTDTQKGHARANNINLMLPFGPVENWVDPGVNIAGRPMYQIITRDWFVTRLEERVALRKIQASEQGRKITVDAVGQEIFRAEGMALAQQGTFGESPHFLPDQVVITMPEITDADRAARRLRMVVAMTTAEDAISFETTGALTTELVIPL